MSKRKKETAASLRGVRAQLRAAINRDSDSGCIVLTVRQGRRIEEALRQFERLEHFLTEPSA